MDFIRNIFAEILIFFYNMTDDYGLAIILLTLAVRIVTLPLSMKQISSTKAMQKIAPEQKKLQEKYKNDKEKLNAEMMKLYKENKVNPLGGCLPLLIQFPVLIAVFGVLREPSIMYNAIPDFSPLFFGAIDLNMSVSELFKEASQLYQESATVIGYIMPAIIPLLAGATTFLQTKLTTAGQSSSAGGMGTMTMLMPLMIIVFSYNLPQGLPLYWLAGNIFSIIQHYIVARPKPIEEGGA